MRRIWKYVCPIGDAEEPGQGFEIEIPKGGIVIETASQSMDSVTFWVLFDEQIDRGGNVMMEKRRFKVFGTGHPINEGWSWRGTSFAGILVWHLFEK